MRMTAAVMMLLGAGMAAAACTAAPPECADASLALVNVNVVSVDEARVLPEQTVLIRGNRICAVVAAAGAAVPEGATVVNGGGRYLMPGLWDMHVHALWDTQVADLFMSAFVANGVTGVRDMGGDLGIALEVRRRQRAGELVAPRLVVAGPIVDGPVPVHAAISMAVTDSAEAVAAVDSLAGAGVDFIKVYTLLPPDAYAAVAARARMHGLAVAGHAPPEVPVEELAREQRSIEHLREEVGMFCSRADSVACAGTMSVFQAAPVWQTPTLVVLHAKTHLDDTSLTSDPRVAQLPPVVTADWEALRQARLRRNDAAAWREAKARWQEQLWLTGQLHRAGVPLLAGTDAGVLYTYPGSSLHDELELLVEAGLTPAEALRTATTEPARYLGASDSLGAVGVGMVADLLLLEENPLDDVRRTRGIAGVVLNGRYLSRAMLQM
jgi:imidazolonepropionase-like amidohydrolase